MKKCIVVIILMFFSALVSIGQGSWIDYNRTYYKIPTSHDGIHRITFTTLSASGINPSSFDPRNIRLFHRGEEVSVYIQGEQDGSFDSGDFLDFYGRRNDGTLDAKFYQDPSHVGNIQYNTHSDSTAFFLTFTPGVQGKRMNTRPLPNQNSPVVDYYHTEYFEVFSDQYNLGQVYNPGTRLSEFEEGQGWMSAPITKGRPRDFLLNNLGQIPSIGSPKIELGLTGRSSDPHLTIVNAGPSASALREVGRFEYSDYQAINVEMPFQVSDFNSDGSLTVQLVSSGISGTDNVSIAYLRITYPKETSGGDFSEETFLLPDVNSSIRIPNALSNYVAHEVSDPLNPVRINVGKDGNDVVLQGGVEAITSKIYVENQSSLRQVNIMRPVRFRNLLNQPADFIILTHPSLRKPSEAHSDPVIAYAAHRASADGGGYDTLVVNINDLYDQFTFGEKTPLAVFEFLRAYYPLHKPDFLFLVGRAMGMFSTARDASGNFFYRHKPSIFTFQDLIPPSGYPYSDNNFSIGLDPENPFISAVSIGRLPARTPEEVANYLEKVREKDAVGASEDWQKEIVHLSGGASAFELTRYFNFLEGFKTIAEGPFMGANVTTYRKRSNSTIELIDISGDVNRGVSLITFFGHGAPSIIDIEIGFASDPTMGYNNRGKYPMLLLNGCDAGNSYGNVLTFGEDWVLTPFKGSTNFMAHANVGVDVYLRRLSESFYTKAFSDSSMIYQPVGLVKRETEKLFYSRYGTSPLNRSHAEQLVMLGDPAIPLFPAKLADYSLDPEEVMLGAFGDEQFNALADSLKLSFVIKNLGRVDLDSVDFKITRRLPDGTNINFDPQWIDPVFKKDTIIFSLPNTGVSAFGDNVFTLEINPSRNVEELTFANNSITVSKFIPLSGTLNLLP